MKTQQLNNPLDKLYCLMSKREKIMVKADHIDSLLNFTNEEQLKQYEILIQNTERKTLKIKHHKSLKKVLKTLNKSYQKRLAKTERQIQQHIQENIKTTDNGQQ